MAVTAIDIALEPDAKMMQHARDANARLLKDFLNGFTVDETCHPHISILQRFVAQKILTRYMRQGTPLWRKRSPQHGR